MEDPEEQRQGGGRYRGRNAYFAKRIPSKPSSSSSASCDINHSAHRSCLRVNFNRSLLVQLSNKHAEEQAALDALLIDLPPSFSSEKHYQESLQPLVMKEAVSQAKSAIRRGNVRSIAITIADAKDGELRCALDPFVQVEPDMRSWLRPSTLFTLHVQGNKAVAPFHGMMSQMDALQSGAVVFDVLPDPRLAGMKGSALKAFPIVALVSIQRMYKACQQLSKPPFLLQILGGGNAVAAEEEEEEEADESSDSDEEEWTAFAYASARRKGESGRSSSSGRAEDHADDASDSSGDSEEEAAGGSEEEELNESQEEAIGSFMESAVTAMNRVHLWQGPPGTGKTRTIVALLLRLMRTKDVDNKARVLVCAPSNHAIQVVMESFIRAVRADVGTRASASRERAVPAAIVGVEEKIPERLLRYHPSKLLDYWIGRTREAMKSLEREDLAGIVGFAEQLSADIESKLKSVCSEVALSATLNGLMKYIPLVLKRKKVPSNKPHVTNTTIVTCLKGLLGNLQLLKKMHSFRVEEECLASVQFVFCTLNVSGRAAGNGSRGFDILIVDEAGTMFGLY